MLEVGPVAAALELRLPWRRRRPRAVHERRRQNSRLCGCGGCGAGLVPLGERGGGGAMEVQNGRCVVGHGLRTKTQLPARPRRSSAAACLAATHPSSAAGACRQRSGIWPWASPGIGAAKGARTAGDARRAAVDLGAPARSLIRTCCWPWSSSRIRPPAGACGQGRALGGVTAGARRWRR